MSIKTYRKHIQVPLILRSVLPSIPFPLIKFLPYSDYLSN